MGKKSAKDFIRIFILKKNSISLRLKKKSKKKIINQNFYL